MVDRFSIKKRTILPLFASITLALALALAFTFSSSSAAPLKLLFIGNSFTNSSNLPATVDSIAATSTFPITSSAFIMGGYDIRNHWNDGSALAKINQGGWDYVILQSYVWSNDHNAAL
jgi:hypothetical protein